MKSVEYWRERALQRETAYQSGMRPVIAEIQSVYERAFENIEKELKSIDRQIGKKGGLKEIPASDLGAYMARQERLQHMQDVVYKQLNKVYGIEKKTSTAAYTRVMNEGYYRTVFDLQKGTGLAYSFDMLPEMSIDSALRATWLNHNYSTSVWKNTRKLAEQAYEVINAGVVSGAGSDAMAIQLEEVMRVGQFAAERLIRTETNYFANQGELAAYEEAGVEWYRYLATLDLRTSKLCRELDGERVKVGDAVVGKNYPPMHAFCRSTTVAVFDDEAVEGLKRRAKGENGEYELVPASMSYKEWREKYTYVIPTDKNIDILSISDSLEPNKNIFNTADGAKNTIIISRRNLESIYADLNENEISYVMAAHKTVLEHGLKNKTEMFLAFDKSSGKIVLQKIGSKDEIRFKTAELTKAEKDSIIFIHNHPSSAAFSPADFNTLNALEAVKYMGLQGHSGDVYSLSVGDGARFKKEIKNNLQKYFEAELDKLGHSIDTMDKLNEHIATSFEWKYKKE